MNQLVTSVVRLQLAADAVASMHRGAEVSFPDEACGILLGRFDTGGEVVVGQVVLTPNRASAGTRAKRYEIDPKLLLHWDRIAQKGGMSIVGFFHSHPNAEPVPSRTDAELAWQGYVYVIVGVSPRTGESTGSVLVNGLAAWTYDEASTTFNEVPVNIDIAHDQIDYFI
jgi:proteasome lid subunit RPN8/RPN11